MAKAKRANKTELAALLSYSTTTIHKHLGPLDSPVAGAPKPDGAGKYDVGAVDDWICEQQQRDAGPSDEEERELNKEHKRLRNRLLEIKADQLEGNLIPRDVAADAIWMIHQNFMTPLRLMAPRALAKYGDKAIVEAVGDLSANVVKDAQQSFREALDILFTGVGAEDGSDETKDGSGVGPG